MSKVGPVLSRKAFILPAMAVTGAGVGFGLRLMPGTESGAIEMNNWITVSPNNTITVRVAQMEMGQGVMTSLPQLLADDLDPHAARDTGSMAGHRRDAGIPPARCVGRFCREAVRDRTRARCGSCHAQLHQPMFSGRARQNHRQGPVSIGC